MLNWQMDGQRDRRTDRKPWFCRTLCGTGVQLLKQFKAFLNLYQNTRNQFISLIYLWDTANFIFLQLEWIHPFMTTPIPIFFNQLLISLNLYQHAKIQAFSSFHSRDIIYLKILPSDWSETFWYRTFPRHFQVYSN